MECLILAAGYATRLYPLTENFPKPLLKVGDKAILDWLVDDIASTGAVDRFVVISNHKFAGHFRDWAAMRPGIAVVDDGTSTNETRLGAVRDIQFAIESLGIDDDLLVIAGDNILDFSLAEFIRYASTKRASCIMRYYEANEARLHKSGVAEVAADDRVLSFVEKPAEPRSHWCVPAFYYYKRQDSHIIQSAIDGGCGTDAPGSFISWLCGQTSVYAWEMPGKRYDIGNLESYEQVKQIFEGKR